MAKSMMIMSLAIEPERHKLLKSVAKKKDMSVSELIRWLVDQFPLEEDGEEVDYKVYKISKTEKVVPIIYKIPQMVLLSKEDLRKWLNLRTEVLVEKLANV